MKTREQLISEIGWISDHLIGTGEPEKIIDLVVEACEEAIKESPEWAFENLKKLKSSKAIEEIKL